MIMIFFFLLRWRLRPHIVPDTNETSQYEPLRRHVESLYWDYVGERSEHKDSDILIINLIDKKGRQGTLGNYYISSISRLI